MLIFSEYFCKSPLLSRNRTYFLRQHGINTSVQNSYPFYPPRRNGYLFLSGLLIFLSLGWIISVWISIHSQTSLGFLSLFLPSVLILSAVPAIIYYIYALRNALYLVERDGIRLYWGLRQEDIPITEIQWVHHAEDLEMRLPLPLVRLPGAVIGSRTIKKEGEIEYLASSTRNLVIIARIDKAYALSPSQPAKFINAYQRFTEMGSFIPFDPQSVYPSNIINRVFRSPPARLLIVAGALVCIALLAMVAIGITSGEYIHLRFLSDGTPGEPIPAIRLLLLPLLNTFFFLVDLFAGLYFYLDSRREHLAFLLWGTGLFTAIVFMGGALFILGTR